MNHIAVQQVVTLQEGGGQLHVSLFLNSVANCCAADGLPEQIEKILIEQFTGTIQQRPPIFSALKKDGKRLYTYARAGVAVEIEPRPVEIHQIRIKEIALPSLTLEIVCGKGTYIRSLAHDLGLALESRAHLSSLVRTQSGEYHVADAFTPEEFRTFINQLER